MTLFSFSLTLTCLFKSIIHPLVTNQSPITGWSIINTSSINLYQPFICVCTRIDKFVIIYTTRAVLIIVAFLELFLLCAKSIAKFISLREKERNRKRVYLFQSKIHSWIWLWLYLSLCSRTHNSPLKYLVIFSFDNSFISRITNSSLKIVAKLSMV